jgi:hypothetical protein
MILMICITLSVMIIVTGWAILQLQDKNKKIVVLDQTIILKDCEINRLDRETHRLSKKITALENEITDLNITINEIKAIKKPGRPVQKMDPIFIPTPSENHTAIKAFSPPVYHMGERRHHSERSTRWDHHETDGPILNDGLIETMIAAEIINDLRVQTQYAPIQEEVFFPAGGSFDGGGSSDSYDSSSGGSDDD